MPTMSLWDVLFVVGLLLGGLLTTGFGVADYQNRQANFENAVEIDGTIQNVEVQEQRDTDQIVYRPNITYTYSFNENRYTTDTIYPGIYEYTKGSQESAEEFASQYTVGETTTVYVNTHDPSQAFLIKDPQDWRKLIRPYITMGVGILMTLIGIVFSGSWLLTKVKNSQLVPL